MHSTVILSLGLLGGSALAQQAPLWGQCGGNGWTGPTVCADGSCCSTQNAWYAQCTPGSGCPGSGSGPTTTTAGLTTTTRPPVITTTTTTGAQVPTTTAAPPVSPVPQGRLVQVSGFGSNPTGTQMFVYVPNKIAANPAVVVAVGYSSFLVTLFGSHVGAR